MKKHIEDLMRSWNSHEGDRVDPVAKLCRQLYCRASLCPCMQQPECIQCQNDKNVIEEAWEATNGSTDRSVTNLSEVRKPRIANMRPVALEQKTGSIWEMTKHYLDREIAFRDFLRKNFIIEACNDDTGTTLVDDQPCTPFPDYCVTWPCCKEKKPLENRNDFMTCPLCGCSYGKVHR